MKKYTFIAFLLACLPMFAMGQSTLRLSITGYDAKCNGSINGSAKVTASGGVAPYSYVWTPAAGTGDSVSGLAAGVYSVTVTDSMGHTASVSVTINQPPALVVYIDSIVVMPCFRTTSGSVCGCFNTLWAIVSGGTPPYSYLWTPGGYTGDTLAEACYIEFTVNVTDNNNCVSADSIDVVAPTFPTIITTTTGTAEISNANSTYTYPNPASNQLNISLGQSAGEVRSLAVYDMMGGKVYEQQVTGNARLVTIDVSRFAAGSYLLKIIGDGAQETTHFTIFR